MFSEFLKVKKGKVVLVKAMNECIGIILLILKLRHWMEVSRQVYVSAVLPRERHRYVMERILLDRRVQQEVSQKRKISHICRDLAFMSFIKQSSNDADYTTSALPQMHAVNFYFFQLRNTYNANDTDRIFLSLFFSA